MQYLNLRNSVYIDCTADAGIAATYRQVLNSFVSVVTANKIACSSEYSHYQDSEKDCPGKECEVHV